MHDLQDIFDRISKGQLDVAFGTLKVFIRDQNTLDEAVVKIYQRDFILLESRYARITSVVTTSTLDPALLEIQRNTLTKDLLDFASALEQELSKHHPQQVSASNSIQQLQQAYLQAVSPDEKYLHAQNLAAASPAGLDFLVKSLLHLTDKATVRRLSMAVFEQGPQALSALLKENRLLHLFMEEEAEEGEEKDPALDQALTLSKSLLQKILRAHPDVGGLELDENDLTGCEFRKLQVAEGTIRKSCLKFVKLEGCVFNDTDWRGVVFERSLLQRCRFDGGEMVGGQGSLFVRGCDFERFLWAHGHHLGSELSNLKWRAVDMLSTRWPECRFGNLRVEGGKWQKSAFQKLAAKNLYLQGLELEDCFLDRAQWEKGDLAAARVEGSSLTGATLTEVNLKGVHFKGCNLGGITFRRSRLEDVTFEDCNLGGSTWEEATLMGVTFQAVNFSSAKITSVEAGHIRISGGLRVNAHTQVPEGFWEQASFEAEADKQAVLDQLAG